MKRPNLFWTTDPDTIGEMLRQVRISKSVDQKDVAAHLKCTPGFVANVEAGRRLPSTPQLCRWLKFLGMVWMFRVEEDQ